MFVRSKWKYLAPVVLAAALAPQVGCGGGDELGMKLSYDQTQGRVIVSLERALGADESIHVRVRRGHRGTLDCAQLVAEVTALASTGGDELVGPAVDAELLRPFYGPEWGQGEPTPEMLAALEQGTDTVIDACVVRDGSVVQRVEKDFFAAWDEGRRQGLGGKADDASGETRIHSPQAYGERCVAELGEIPFFEKTAEGEYSTYNCLDSVAIPMTVTDDAGNVTNPDSVQSKCDKPQYIYSSCEPGPRVASKINDQGTRWVLLCRKSIGGFSSAKFNDIAMIGHNPYTGKTCYFQNALYSKTDGEHVPHPADKTRSENLWSGVHGGVGTGIECAKCHDADPWIHTPWIDGAVDANGRPVVPKMGVDEDYPMGANDAPYAIVNLAGQGWTMPKQLVSPQANACLRCHRIGNGRWLDWATRLDGTDPSFRNITTPEYLEFRNIHWMPPETTGLSEETWATSDFGRALEFIKGCNRNQAGCEWKDIPATAQDGGQGGKLRNPVDLPNRELALRSLQLLGANVEGATDRCNECHSMTRTSLRKWRVETDAAVGSCLNEMAPGTSETQTFAMQAVAQNEFKTFGPFEVATGGTFEATMSGDGDADLFVRKNAEVSTSEYDCRPYASGSEEACGSEQFAATGPGKFYVGISGYAATSTVTLTITHTVPSNQTVAPRQLVDCMRLDPQTPTTPFMPGKIGIYTAAAHLGWFHDLFRAAYPTDAPGSSVLTWAIEYTRFKLRVSMPKGNHPKLTQQELDIVAEWFARGLPELEQTLPEEPPPSSCDTHVGGELQTHLATMRTQGWAATNAERGMNMFGCEGGDALSCLAAYPRTGDKGYATAWEHAPGTKLRVLRELTYNTFFWMRSSADGRFVANGATGGAGSMIADLQRDRDIPTHAAYDPGFFPDNSGFVFQGTSIGAGFCDYDLLTSGPAEIKFDEPECSAASSVGLYQHLGAGLGGADYFIINSQFESDNGGHSATLQDPGAGFSSTAQIKLTPMVQTGQKFVQGQSVQVETPFEGDSVLSPSTRLLVSRLSGPGAKQLGFVIRRVNATPTEAGYAITTPEVARVCVKGGKPAFSFDERFLVLHHYVEAGDFAELGFASAEGAGFQAYLTKGAANIYIVDLTTGAKTRVTNLEPGQYALFPHFRSDGWIYFLVRDSNTNKEYVVASDAALVAAQ